MGWQKWNKKLNYVAYPPPVTKLKGPVHIPQLVFFALLSCTLWACLDLEVLHRGPLWYRTLVAYSSNHQSHVLTTNCSTAQCSPEVIGVISFHFFHFICFIWETNTHEKNNNNSR